MEAAVKSWPLKFPDPEVRSEASTIRSKHICQSHLVTYTFGGACMHGPDLDLSQLKEQQVPKGQLGAGKRLFDVEVGLEGDGCQVGIRNLEPV